MWISFLLTDKNAACPHHRPLWNAVGQWLANGSVVPSRLTSSTVKGWLRPSGISMPGEPIGMPGSTRPSASGFSSSRRLMSEAGTWPSIA